MSKTVALVLVVCALALPPAALGALPVGAKGTGVLAPGCPTDPVASDVFCPTNPIWFSLQAEKRPTSIRGVMKSRWVVPGHTTTTFTGVVTCVNTVGNTVAFGGRLTYPRALAGVPFVEYAVDNGVSGDLVSDLGLFPDEDADFSLLPVGFPTVCPAPGLAASIYGYLPLQSGNVVVRPPTP